MAKLKARNIFEWFFELARLVWEIILFILNIPRYMRRFLEGLRILSKSYDEITNGLKEAQRTLKENSNLA